MEKMVTVEAILMLLLASVLLPSSRLSQAESLSDWVMFHGDLQHIGYREESITPPLEPIWKVWAGAHQESTSPSVKDGVLYIGGSERLWALNASSGSTIWQSQWFGQMIKTTPAIDGDTVYFSTWNGTYALNRLDGSLKWKFVSQHENLSHWGFFIDSSPIILNDVVYVGLNDGYLYAINASTGTMIWEFKTNAPIKCTPAIYGGKVFFGSGHGGTYQDHNFYAVNLDNGTPAWSKTLAYDTVSSAAIYDGIVYVGSGQYVYALTVADGTELWTYDVGSGNLIESSPVVTQNIVYISGGDWSQWSTIGPIGSLYALNRTTGQLKWSAGTSFTRISPSVAGNVIYLGTYNMTRMVTPENYLHSIDGDTGSILWSYPLQDASTSIPAIAEGRVYLAADGYIYAFEPFAVKSVLITPATPEYDDDVSITARITGDVAEAFLNYTYGFAWHTASMSKSGGTYTAAIPSQPYGTLVQYKIHATDTYGSSIVSVLQSYIVGDFTAPSVEPSQIPESPLPEQKVKIYANVTEPTSSSGIKAPVFLSYRANGEPWWNTTMVYNESLGLFERTIPMQSEGTIIEYFVRAIDNAGNVNTTEIYGYTALSSDINHDGIVSVQDLFIIGKAFGSHVGEEGYDPEADVNKDGTIDSQELTALKKQYGEDM